MTMQNNYLDLISATAAMIGALATVALVLFGRQQIREIRLEAKKERTLVFCTRYASDAILVASARNLGEAYRNKELDKSPLRYRSDAASILNYLDCVAIGIAENVYDESMARSRLQSILVNYVEFYLSDKMAVAMHLRRAAYQASVKLSACWSKSRPYGPGAPY